MRFTFRNVAASLAFACFVFGGACEQHHVGELPEVQKEHLDGAERGEHADHSAPKDVDPNNEMVKQAVPVYAPSAAPPNAGMTATPANFVPEEKKP
jgi:hypothetical protein